MKETVSRVACSLYASGKRTIYYEMGAGAADAVLTAAGDKISDLTDQASEAWHGEWGDEWDWMENQPGW